MSTEIARPQTEPLILGLRPHQYVARFGKCEAWIPRHDQSEKIVHLRSCAVCASASPERTALTASLAEILLARIALLTLAKNLQLSP